MSWGAGVWALGCALWKTHPVRPMIANEDRSFHSPPPRERVVMRLAALFRRSDLGFALRANRRYKTSASLGPAPRPGRYQRLATHPSAGPTPHSLGWHDHVSRTQRLQRLWLQPSPTSQRPLFTDHQTAARVDGSQLRFAEIRPLRRPPGSTWRTATGNLTHVAGSSPPARPLDHRGSTLCEFATERAGSRDLPGASSRGPVRTDGLSRDQG